MLRAHNTARQRVGTASLTWSSQLAALSQKWANTLLATGTFRHPPGSPYGSNLFEITGGTASPEQVVRDWAGEVRDYNYRSNTCRAVCGHYTQIVWNDTKEVGCAVARRSRTEIWVCEYNPPGNWVGKKPY